MSGQRRRGPAHQNTFAFRHNPKSKKTEKILASPIEGLCQRCHEKVEWRKKYRKYKPLTTPATCQGCHTKSVRAAYHRLCDPCAQSRKVCAGCAEPKHIVNQTGAASSLDVVAQRELLEREIKGLHLRKQRKLLRDFDKSNGLMDVKAAVAKAQAEDGEEEDDDDDWDDDDDDEEEEDEEEEDEELSGDEDEEVN